MSDFFFLRTLVVQLFVHLCISETQNGTETSFRSDWSLLIALAIREVIINYSEESHKHFARLLFVL